MTRVVLFDAAGTLMRVRGSVGTAYSSIAAAHGVEVPAQEIETAFVASFGRRPPLCFPDQPAAALPTLERKWWKELVLEVFGKAKFADFDAYFDELFDYFADPLSWELFPDVMSAVELLCDRGIRMGVISNFDGRLTGICEGLGLTPYLDAIVMSARVGYAKPDPGIFRVALEVMGAIPAEALHVGNSEEEDVRGAQGAGLRALLITRRGRSERRGEIDDLRRLVDHL
jgi:putative hydrolase of the HAD superfamily